MEDINCEGLPHIRVLAGENTDGPVYESLPARQIDEHVYELLASPGLTLNLARGDIVSIADPLAPAEVLKRGGNFCIQIYADDVPQEAVDQLERDVQEQLGGTMDGQYKGNLAFSVPGREAVQSRVDIEPGVTSARHFHAGEELVYDRYADRYYYVDRRSGRTYWANGDYRG